MMRAEQIAERIDWPTILAQLGVPVTALCNRHGPCPVCGGRDRFRFDNRHRRGDFYCNGCGAGSGYDLLMRLHGWDFRTARDQVVQAAGIVDNPVFHDVVKSIALQELAQPTDRVLRLRTQSCAVVDCQMALEYLAGRRLWPLPAGCTLRAHPSVEYFEAGQRVGRYPALIAPVLDLDGHLVSLHITHLEHGAKLTVHEPRKLLSPLTGRTGCAVRLVPAAEVLGIAEGIETAIAAHRLHQMPIWSALNASLLAKFEPPPEVKRLVIFADRDTAGLEAAAALMQRLQGRVRLEIRTPRAPAKDWNDVLLESA
jgi:putative DNA primase/helicase